MQKQNIIILSGKKQSGKNTAARFIIKEWANILCGYEKFNLTKVGKEYLLYDTSDNQIVDIDNISSDRTKSFTNIYGCKIYSFADELKRFLINTFGLDYSQCYGSDDEKNSPTHISWETISSEIRTKYAKIRSNGDMKLPNGNMSGREVMQVFGSDICRKMDENCWARALYSSIKENGYKLSVITDARFANEITMGTEYGAIAIRLMRKVNDDQHISEIALDSFPLGEFSQVIQNQNFTVEQTQAEIKKYLPQWFKIGI